MTAANAEPVRVAVAPKPHTDRFTASTITDEQLDALYAERDALAADVRRLGLMVDEYGTGAGLLMDKITRVREVHARVKNAHTDSCMHCSERDYPDYEVAWPCPTVAALDGPSPAPATPSVAPESHTGLRGAPGAPGGPR